MVIDRSMTVRPGTYRLAASPDVARPAITIRGENITVDFNGAVLAGGPDNVDPDGYAGRILIDGGRRITVKNAVIRGYKVGILARRLRTCTCRTTTSPTTGSRGSTAASRRKASSTGCRITRTTRTSG